MDSRIVKSVLAGIVATAVMTMVMFIAPMMGMPKMSPPEMLAGMMGMPVIVGWMMHFMIGVIFAFGYLLVFAPNVKIDNSLVKGLIYGIAIFIFAQIIMKVMGMMLPMPKMEGSMMLMMVGSLIGHVIFGIVTAFIANSRQILIEAV